MLKNKIFIFPVLLFTLLSLSWGISDAVAQSASKSDLSSSIGPNIKPVALPLGIVSFDRCKKPEYPRPALRDELVGKTEMDLIADADGKVIIAEVARSSGWRILDNAIITAIMGCQIFDSPKAEKTFGRAAYFWRLEAEGSSYKPAEVLTATCNKSEFVSLAKDNEPGRGIVVGVWLNKDGGIEKTSLEWSLDPKLNQESVKLVSSCKFKPAFDAVGNLASVISLRLLPLRSK
ncbi:MAG: energy transducer TonB [Burkholderiales bacterium]|nr:energy transducer TonB [Burkholderiales bacterium]MBI3728820.1 energy transducer TonB [Burkholderiales bacterium]